ncbi:quinol dehydrogenase ferredoxin subunit NapH [Sulfurospirillum diekertiae]|uniref:Nitrate reductase quinol dehydrogenase, membrane component NapH n=1 Tax=Sulfurospirillum diekertiae TaxID=1854492 RepID=A0A290HUE3_9BACT|nr:quinol dehydrogenase ferredoxin subunit NapH [Sulfurospirillum diekertiae]ATB68989.1 nitrate reductase quinol dehydrogenase, membrane component NapH [Sulfurospirillum diekertiae]QIR76774.1 quinol dehydrogenase ferredoxin subunit NapH [Sulfurospirillum diekertiae]QIR79405.1 quinol dehydrogenase ferredoxin subunit NapH [Sulfurospirillum diekertiae]
MREWIRSHRFMMARRFTQLSILGLFVAANGYGFRLLNGDLSASLVMKKLPLADPFALLQILATGAIVGIDVLTGAALILLFYMVVGGRAFCSWVCPLNMVTDAANGTRRVLLLDKTVEKKVWMSRNVRYWVLALSLILSFMTGVAAFEMVSPIGILNRGIIFGMGMSVAPILCIYLFDLFAVKNGWCGHICPLGGFYSLVGRLSLVRIKHDHTKCTLCMKCKEICPEKQVLGIISKRSGAITSGECTNCGRCVEVCESDALSFGVRNYINTNVGEKE